jgi:hypothetical protein
MLEALPRSVIAQKDNRRIQQPRTLATFSGESVPQDPEDFQT